MILLSLDFETTGLDFVKDRIIEIGAVLYSTGQKKCLENYGCLVKSDVPISAEITKLTGIHQSAVDKFGFDQDTALDNLQRMIIDCDALIGQNVLRFDKLMYEAWCRRLHLNPVEKLWIDTMTDIPGVEGKKLSYQAADHGFLNMFPHSAMADCQTVLSIIEKYDINEIVKRAKTPTVIIQAHHNRNQNELAKKAKFRWNPDHKIWWKAVKESDVDELERSVTFPIGFASKEVTLESLISS